MQIPLMGGAYQARSIIASAQRCLNLYPEINQRESFLMIPETAGAPTLLTHYPTPGLTVLPENGATSPPIATWRGLYRANNGSLYGVAGNSVYYIAPDWTFNLLGNIDLLPSVVSMADNGVTLLLVDGSANGYKIDLATNAFAPLTDPTGLFVGADKVDYIDTFFVFNKPGTQAFYCSLSNEIAFDPTYIANKTGVADLLVTLCIMERQIWLFGQRTTEVWYDAGGALFPFAITEGTFIQHGCAAKYSVCTQDTNMLWLSQDDQGHGIVMKGNNYQATRISTHAIEHAIQAYPRIDDAIGHIHQMDGHTFYVLTFPTADATWVYDVATDLWHERAWIDDNGIEHRVRPQVGCAAYGVYVCGDWQNGNLYKYDIENYTDNGQPIRRVRSFPHVLNELKRVQYTKFIADMQTGADTNPIITVAS